MTASPAQSLRASAHGQRLYVHKRKRPPRGQPLCAQPLRRVLLLRVTLAELVHSTAGVDDLVLARVERVRRRADIDLDQRILITVFPLDLLLAAKGRAGQEREIRGHVLEDDFAVLGMDAGLHGTHQFNAGKRGSIRTAPGVRQVPGTPKSKNSVRQRPTPPGPGARTGPGRSAA